MPYATATTRRTPYTTHTMAPKKRKAATPEPPQKRQKVEDVVCIDDDDDEDEGDCGLVMRVMDKVWVGAPLFYSPSVPFCSVKFFKPKPA